ncbi:MAG TPA: glycosyltransferase [Acidimicrobiales bacterium]|nr:glycosyltransferase [Acidimicrobiales bacterium]
MTIDSEQSGARPQLGGPSTSRRLVACAFDDRYLWPWACSALSAVAGANRNIEFLVANVNGLLSREAIDLVSELLDVFGAAGRVLDVRVDIKNFERYQWNLVVYARLRLLDTLDEPFLWLDSDTLLRPGWDELFNLSDQLFDNETVVACAVLDRQQTLDHMSTEGTNQAYSASKGAYFNSGVFAADPLRWRSGGFAEEWLPLVAHQEAHGFTFPDQDILNFLLAGRVGLLPRAFNHIVSEPTTGEEKVLHYAGYPKPWRLDPKGRAFFIATEALNADRPNHQVSGGGTAWHLFPLYWEQERILDRALIERGRQDVVASLHSIRSSQLVNPGLQERVKLSALRLLARDLLGA